MKFIKFCFNHWKVSLVALFILFCLGAWATFPYWTYETVTVLVTDKEGQVGVGNLTIFTTTETFKNHDSKRYLKFRSGDLQGRFVIGEEYTVGVYGWRIPPLSKFRNIVRIVE